MRGRYIKRDDVDTLPDAEDVTRVNRIPERGCMAKMRLGCEQELQSYVRWRWRIGYERARVVGWVDDAGAEAAVPKF